MTGYPLFQRFGVELEYMIVDAETLDIRPEADELIRDVAGGVDEDVSRGRIEWSNELALHLIELKTGRPASSLARLSEVFHGEVRFINERLARRGALLLPGAMHPWMNPRRESKLWPHGSREIYSAFDRIFNCSGHGWTNLQSTHLNLPFSDDEEFARLHGAIRLVLPLLPALAASSPFIDGTPAPNLGMRLEVYRHNCERIPSLTGRVIPEPITTPKDYQKRILRRIYADLAPHDPEGILRHEWSNARGAIARFERNTIEIRVLDIQECPAADLAILQFIVAVLRALVGGKFGGGPEIWNRITTAMLEKLLLATIKQAGAALITHSGYLACFGVRSPRAITAADLWMRLLDAAAPRRAPWRPAIDAMLSEGTLSERLILAAGLNPTPARLRQVYRNVAESLAQNRLFGIG